MKRTILVAVMAVATAVTGVMGASPASAATAPASAAAIRPNIVDPMTVIETIKAAYDAYKDFAAGFKSADSATVAIINAIKQAETAIINHIDAIAAADVRACAQEAVIDFPDFDNLSTDNKQNFALNATSCVTRIDSLLSAVSDKSAIDQLGFSVNAVAPIALMARSKAGLHNTGLIPVVRESDQKVSSALQPSCSRGRGADNIIEWFCSSYNSGSAISGPTQAAAQKLAAQNTSWPIAQNTLAQLANL